MRIRMMLVAMAAAFLLVACGGSASAGTGSGGSSSQSGSTPTPSATSPAASSAALVQTATATVGGSGETVLTNTQGMTLYYYTPDKDASVTCTGSCASAWPPLAAGSGMPPPVSGVSGTFGTAPNPAGGSVVTYNGWPLYTYAGDSAAGQTNGQGKGGVWFVATPTLAATPTGQ